MKPFHLFGSSTSGIRIGGGNEISLFTLGTVFNLSVVHVTLNFKI